MFKGLSYEAWIFNQVPMLLNSHSYGLDPSKFETDQGLKSIFTLTSIMYEPEGDHKAFTASMES
jgi:hypothetical protein